MPKTSRKPFVRPGQKIGAKLAAKIDSLIFNGGGGVRRTKPRKKKQAFIGPMPKPGGSGLYTGMGKYNFLKSTKKIQRALGSKLISGINSYGGGGLYTGRGAYSATNNLIASGVRQNGVPAYEGLGDETGGFVLTHKEYVTDIYAPGVAGSGVITPFSVQTMGLNPGLQQSFQFLSQIAQNYEEYTFVQLVYEYRSTTTDIGNSTTGQCGTIIIAANYNSGNAPFGDKQSMMEYAHSMSAKVTEDMAFGVECDPSKTALSDCLYIRNAPVPPSEDPKTYDKGTLNIALANCPPAYNGLPLGELWCYYKVLLRKPRLFASRGLGIDGDYFYASTAIGTPTMAPATWFGAAGSTTYLRAQQNNIGCLVTPLTAGCSITFPAPLTANVRVTVVLFGTGLTSIVSPTSYLPPPYAANTPNPNMIFTSTLWAPGGVGSSTPQPGATGYAYNGTCLMHQHDFFIRASTAGNDNVLTYLGATGTTVTAATIRIEQLQTFGSSQRLFNNALTRVIMLNSSGAITTPA